MTINSEFFTYNNAVAMEIFAAGWCNLSCSYCYIPKTDFLKTVHSKIIERIKDGSILKELEEMFGKDLEGLSHWGTEPTLTTYLFKDFYEQAFEKFPKLNRIMLSSNFMTPPKNIIKFVNDIVPRTRKIELAIQMSLDGPAWITDANRLGGSTPIIMANIKEFLANVDVDFHTLALNFKPTIDKVNIKRLSDIEKMKEYYRFYDDFIIDLSTVVDIDKLKLSRSVDPTIAVPDSYNKEDGLNFYKLLMNQLELNQTEEYKFISKPMSFYYVRWREKIDYYREFNTKHKMFTCSAGDSCFAGGDISKELYACHRTFYTNYKEYEDACLNWPMDPETTDGIKQGRNKILKDISTANFENKRELARMLYVNRCYHDFTKHKTTAAVAAIRELAYNNQINSVYKDLFLATELAKLSFVGACHMDNVMASGSFDVHGFSTYRLFGNGVFEKFCKMLIEEEKV